MVRGHLRYHYLRINQRASYDRLFITDQCVLNLQCSCLQAADFSLIPKVPTPPPPPPTHTHTHTQRGMLQLHTDFNMCAMTLSLPISFSFRQLCCIHSHEALCFEITHSVSRLSSCHGDPIKCFAAPGSSLHIVAIIKIAAISPWCSLTHGGVSDSGTGTLHGTWIHLSTLKYNYMLAKATYRPIPSRRSPTGLLRPHTNGMNASCAGLAVCLLPEIQVQGSADDTNARPATCLVTSLSALSQTSYQNFVNST